MDVLIGPVTLFHGTSVSEEKLREEGLHRPDFTCLIKDLAERHSVELTRVRHVLLERRVIGRRENDPYVYLSPKWSQAASYAVGGGEFEEQILGVIYELKNAPITETSHDSPSQQWIAHQMGTRRPVVVTINVPKGVELLMDNCRNYKTHAVPPDWIEEITEVTTCFCNHQDWNEPQCHPKCPRCRDGACPGWEALEAHRPVERFEDDEFTDEEALRRRCRAEPGLL